MPINKLRQTSNSPVEVADIAVTNSIRVLNPERTNSGEIYASSLVLNSPFILNPQRVGAGYTAAATFKLYNPDTKTWTIPANYNAVSAGYLNLETGVTVTISSGSRWTIA